MRVRLPATRAERCHLVCVTLLVTVCGTVAKEAPRALDSGGRIKFAPWYDGSLFVAAVALVVVSSGVFSGDRALAIAGVLCGLTALLYVGLPVY